MTLRSLIAAWLAAALAAAFPWPAAAGTTQSFVMPAKAYPGSRERRYQVYVPDGLAGAAPMVMALHGCRQTNDDVLRDWGLRAAADRFRFILVAPFITSYDGLRNPNCWGFWLDPHRHEGRGEAEDLHQLAREVESRFAIDPARRYILGLSSGGAMSVVAAVTHNEYWAAAASAAGIPYGEDAASVSFACPGSASFHPVTRVVSDMRAELDDAYRIPLMVLQNERDCTVVPQAGRNLRDAHLRAFGTPGRDTPAATGAGQTACTPVFGPDDYGCRHARYTVDGTPAGRSLVETVFYAGPVDTPNPGDTDHGHYWIGGAEGANGLWSLRQGPAYPDLVWDFFSRHPRGDGPAPPPPDGDPVITIVGANPLTLALGDAFTDPGATATDREDGTLPVDADCRGVDTSRPGRYACTYRATDSSGRTATAVRDVVVQPDPACASVTASPVRHVEAGRAVRGGWFGLWAFANGDGRPIGFAWNAWIQVTLHEDQPGRWVTTLPPRCR